MAELVRRSFLVGVFYLLAGSYLWAGNAPQDMEIFVRRARTTDKPEVLRACITILVVEYGEEGLGQVQALLTTEDRLRLLDGKNSTESELSAVLRFVAEHLRGKKASDLFVALAASESFAPDRYYEQKGGDVGDGFEKPHDPVWVRLTERRLTLITTSGFVKEATPELVGFLRGEFAQNWYLAGEALARIGTRESVKVLEEGEKDLAKRKASVVDHVIRFRDRPEVFRFLVDKCLSCDQGRVEASVRSLVLAEYWEPGEYARGEGIKPIGYPLYENIANEHAEAYVKQLDRLLGYMEEKGLRGDCRDGVRRIRALMFEKAEEHRRPKQSIPSIPGTQY